MRAVTNTSPLIYLSRIGRLDLFWQYREVLIPEKVLEEIEAGRERGHPEALDVRRLVRTGHAPGVRGAQGRRGREPWPGGDPPVAPAPREGGGGKVHYQRAPVAH